MLFVGFTAVLILPHLSNGDLSMLTIVQKTFPAWFLGMVGGAGTLTPAITEVSVKFHPNDAKGATSYASPQS